MAEIKGFVVAPRKGDVPFTPFAHVFLAQHSKDENGRILLSPQLMTEIEVDESVNGLIKQLKKAGEKIKKDLLKEKKQEPIGNTETKCHRLRRNIVIGASEIEDFKNIISDHGLEMDDFSFQEQEPIIDTEVHHRAGTITIRRKSTKKEKKYKTGSGSSWPVEFSDDLIAGIFD